MRGGHCLEVWAKKQQVVALSSAESEVYAAVKTALEGLEIQSVAKDLGISCGVNLHLKRSTSTFRICGEESRHEHEYRRLDDETTGEAED